MAVEDSLEEHLRLKFEKEKFVSDLTGGSLSEINTVTLVGLVPFPLQRLIIVRIRVMGGHTNEDESHGLSSLWFTCVANGCGN